ncbi:hypothetical protein KRR26_05710 [Corallococcus sp. M34]|uniref:hypothetical protein n=1 Tax=Citreicoccus inhibens TaxID=2849499 RepID=UPI001C21E23B|nr:hypothetical protein [Citreicoccus inhibens]MBU8895089.1 hypothetical protein [Citreicoccus inhibens]
MVGALLCLAGCSGEKKGSEVDAGTGTEIEDSGTPDSGTDDAGTPDAGAWDAGVEDAGVPDAGPAPCEKTRGVCGGAQRAMVNGVYESVCTALSYGPGYEEVETRCDDLDNDCDGVADPSVTRTVTRLNGELHGGMASSLAVADGILIAVFDTPHVVRVLHVDRQGQLLGVAEIPLAADDPNTGDSVTSALMRTSQGPVLYYAGYKDSGGMGPETARAYLRPLTEAGLPRPQEDEQVVFDSPTPRGASRAALSADGNTLLATWRDITPARVNNLYGIVRDLHGQRIAAPTVLFHSETSSLRMEAVLGLRNGEFLIVAAETPPGPLPQPVTLHVRRFDAQLAPSGPERTLVTSDEPLVKLLDLGGSRGDPLDSVALVMRETSAAYRKMEVVNHLFTGGQPEVWEALRNEPGAPVLWPGASVSAQGLQLAWLAKQEVPSSGSFPRFQGWLWTQSEGYAAVQQTPTAEPIALHLYAQWVLLEDVGARRLAAFYMRSDEQGHTLEVTRTCLLP